MVKRKNEAHWIESRQHWRIDVQKDGQRKSFYSTTPKRTGKIECEAKADAWLMSGVGEDIRFGVLWKEYLDSIDKANSSEHYIKQEQMGRLWLLPKLENKKVSSITLQDMQECVDAPFVTKDLSKKTCGNVRGALTAIYRYAYKRRAPLERPEFLTLPKGAVIKEKQILQPDALKTLFAEDWIMHYGKRVTAFYIYTWRFLVLSGLRRGEAAGIRLEDIEGNVLHVQRSLNSLDEFTPGKNANANRYLVLTSRLAQIVEQQKAHLRKLGIISPWLFPSKAGGPDANAIYKGWIVYRNQRGWNKDVSIHSLRHTMISIVKPFIPEALLKQVVGHGATMDTIGVYGHRVDGEIERAAQIVGQTFDELLGK